MSLNIKGTKVLVGLGLTSVQARAYIELGQLGILTAKQISKVTKIARPDVYRDISVPFRLSLVEKEIGKPTKYETISPQEGVSILMQRRKEEKAQLNMETQSFLKNFKKNNAIITAQNDVFRTVFVLGKSREFWVLQYGQTTPVSSR